MTDRELMQQALDALEKLNKDGWILADFEDEVYASIEALRAALAQPEPEPVAWVDKVWIERPDLVLNLDIGKLFSRVGFEYQVPLYTVPPQRGWQGLTDEERTFLAWESNNGPECVAMTEAKLKEKNHG